MKEFKTFILSVVVFFLLWISFSYLFAGTIVLISGFSEALTTSLQYPVLICLSFIGGVVGAIFFSNNYYENGI